VNPDVPIRIAMWSGPRNISTAMMRAWENRGDAAVVDEPFYAFYLSRTNADHPGRDEIIASGETEWEKVVSRLTIDDLPPGKTIFYQKHMTHHLLPEIDLSFSDGLTNCFLIRDPAEVIASYIKKRQEPTIEDLGFVQQGKIFDYVHERTGVTPPVIDARDVQKHPAKTLGLLCNVVGVEFADAMLSWPAGSRETDGVWAKYWYSEVEKSTGFQPAKSEGVEVPERYQSIYERCDNIYRRLRQSRLD
jgi:hypothetical protein